MTKLEKVTISHNINFRGWCWFLYLYKNNLLKTLTKVITFVEGKLFYMFNIYCLVSDQQDLLQTKIKV